MGETQQFFKCKNSAILCKVNAKVCKKVQEKSLFVRFEILNFRPNCHPEFISGSNQNVVNTPKWQDAETSSAWQFYFLLPTKLDIKIQLLWNWCRTVSFGIFPQILCKNDLLWNCLSNIMKLPVKLYFKIIKSFNIFAKGLNYLENLGRKDSNLWNAWTKTRCLTTWRRPITST